MKEEPQTENLVKTVLKDEIQEINEIIEDFVAKLRQTRRKLRKKLLIKRNIFPLTLAYLPEMISTLLVMKNCVSEGIVSTCYREMRKILESLAWIILDDILLFKKKEMHWIDMYAPPPLRIPNKKWYEWAKEKGLILKSLSQLKKSLKHIIEKINEKYGWKKKQISRTLLNNMTYPLFLILIGANEQIPTHLKDAVPLFNSKRFKMLVERDLERTIIQLKGGPLSDPDKRFIEELVDSLLDNTPPIIVIPYPSTSFVIQLIGKCSKVDVNKPYSKYSYFVHSYDKAWQFYPFSSVLELKILKHELSQFIKLITQLMKFYEKELKI